MKKTDKQQIRYGQYRASSINEENRTAEFVISSESEDTYETVFMSNGWGLERYNQNPVVTFQHNDWSGDPDQVIGTSEVRVEGKELVAVITFENGEDNELAEKVFRKVKNGILRGASIRANVHEARWGNFDDGENPDVLYFIRQDLLAWSIVTVPSNPDALARNTQNLDEIRTQTEKPKGENVASPDKKRTLSRFEAQLLLNENSI